MVLQVMIDQTLFLLMVRVSDKAGLRFTGTVENFKYWLFKILSPKVDEKSLRGVCVLMNWRESCLFALLIASGYIFKISCFKRSRREIYYLVYTVRTSKLLIALSMGESEREEWLGWSLTALE